MQRQYTEFFSEYIANGGEYPSVFDNVPDYNNVSFKKLFLEHFCDKEIGFETEELFAVKFNARADVVCPFYIEKIEDLKNYTDLLNSEKTESIDSLTSMFDKPINSQVDEPNVKAITGQTKLKGGKTFKGVTALEKLEIKERLEKETYNIYNDLLKQFNNIFMGVY